MSAPKALRNWDWNCLEPIVQEKPVGIEQNTTRAVWEESEGSEGRQSGGQRR